MRLLFLLITSIVLSMCAERSEIFDRYKSPDRKDVHSYANPSEAVITHLNLDLRVDFEKNILAGTASYEILHDNAEQIILDTRDLDILNVYTDTKDSVAFNLGPNEEYLGQALTIPLTPGTDKIYIDYRTRPEAAALQWLTPAQTTDKKAPFLFTQGQAILTRTWIPIQDSPGIRITYSARIETPRGMMAVMSASNPEVVSADGVYEFEMTQPIPPYLIALAVGDLEFGAIGPRTGVYAEPSMLEKAVYEFGEMEKMLELAEGLYGPYLWDRYDVIVLPASFPFGGMENPRLTFATPTIIAGDRSLTSLIAHELAHSWSGNLVTNATWNDFWLNEGFTVYFERRIMEALYGEDYASMLAVLGYQDLEEDVQDIGHNHADTHLKLDLAGRDPDEGMTDIAYEKGAYFLGMIESRVGRERFDAFLREYFETHKFQSITTTEFLEYLNANLLDETGQEVDIDAWVYGPGIPSDVVTYESDKFTKVENAVERFLEEDSLSQHDWSTHEWLHFIRALPRELDIEKMNHLDHTYGFSDSGNSEIAAAWFQLSIYTGYFNQNIDQIEAFLINVGRRKFLTPLYRAFKETGHLTLAREIYAKARDNYHSVSIQTMDALLDLG